MAYFKRYASEPQIGRASESREFVRELTPAGLGTEPLVQIGHAEVPEFSKVFPWIWPSRVAGLAAWSKGLDSR